MSPCLRVRSPPRRSLCVLCVRFMPRPPALSACHFNTETQSLRDTEESHPMLCVLRALRVRYLLRPPAALSPPRAGARTARPPPRLRARLGCDDLTRIARMPHGFPTDAAAPLQLYAAPEPHPSYLCYLCYPCENLRATMPCQSLRVLRELRVRFPPRRSLCVFCVRVMPRPPAPSA